MLLLQFILPSAVGPLFPVSWSVKDVDMGGITILAGEGGGELVRETMGGGDEDEQAERYFQAREEQEGQEDDCKPLLLCKILNATIPLFEILIFLFL